MSRCLTQEARFLVLNKKAAWDRGLPINLDVSDDGLTIRRVPEYVFAQENEIEVLSDTFEVTDFAVAQCSQLFILDAASPAIWIYDTDQKLIERIDCINALFRKPTSIAYGADTLFVADVEAGARVYGLSALNWQIKLAIDATPHSETLSLAAEFAPIDLAVDVDGNLFALDRQNLAILKFDQTARLIEVFGQIELKDKQPVNIALSRNNVLYVLELSEQKVLKFSLGGTGISVNSNFIDFQALKGAGVLPAEFVPSGLAVDTDGLIFVGDKGARPPDQEDDRFIRKFDTGGKYIGFVEDFRGAVDQMVLDLSNSIFVFRKEEKNRITALKREQRFALLEDAALVKGRYVSQALDSNDAGTTWHKLSAKIDVPARAQVQLSFLAADDRTIAIAGENQNLDDYLEETGKLDPTVGAEKTELQKRLAALDELNWSRPVVNSSDALITATGRYLWARIDLVGNELESPAIHSLRVDYPRISYLRYLPSVYQDDEKSRDFLERFLALFETFFAGIEAQVDHIARYFDPDANLVSGDFLRWLSTWLAISVDNNWDEAKLRTLLKRAAQLYPKRGTRAAIEEMIEIFTGQRPLVIEHHQTICATALTQLPDADEVRKLYQRLYGDDSFCFCVLLRPFPAQTEEQFKSVRRIIDAEKPAHTCAGLMALQPWVQLDTHTYLEINTYLSEPSARLDTGSAMPRDTVLNDDEPAGQLERRSRIDLDITLT